MFKFKVKCPHCGEEVEYRILGRDYDDLTCPHCHKRYQVNMRVSFLIIMLLLFYLCTQVYSYFLRDVISLPIALIAGVFIVGILSVLITHGLSKLLGIEMFFETQDKIPDKKNEKKRRK